MTRCELTANPSRPTINFSEPMSESLARRILENAPEFPMSIAVRQYEDVKHEVPSYARHWTATNTRNHLARHQGSPWESITVHQSFDDTHAVPVLINDYYVVRNEFVRYMENVSN